MESAMTEATIRSGRPSEVNAATAWAAAKPRRAWRRRSAAGAEDIVEDSGGSVSAKVSEYY